MQLMIDTADSPELLTLAAKFLDDAAKLGKHAAPRIVDVPAPIAPSVPSGTVALDPPVVVPANTPTAVQVPPPPPPPPVEIPTASAAPVIPAPPTASAVASPAPTAPAPSGDRQLDKRGFPFDERIHSGKAPGTINKSDGLWRTRRGVDNALIEAVEAELREQGYGVAVPAAPLVPPPPAQTSLVPPPPAQTSLVPPPAAATVIPPPPSAGNSGQPASVPSGQDAGQVDKFRELMTTIGGHTGPDGKCRRDVMAPIYERLLGKPGGLSDFHKARDKIPELLVEVRRIIAA